MVRRIDVIGRHLVLGVDAASEEDAGVASVEEGSTEEILGGTVSIVVAPVAGFAPGERIFHPSHGIIDDAMIAIHVNKIFSSLVGVGHIGGMAYTAPGVHPLGSDALGIFGP